MKKVFIKILALGICATFAFANELEFSSLQGNFKQTVTSKESKIVYEGEFYIDSNDQKAFWNYISPNKKQVFIDKDRVTIVEPSLEQVILTHIQKAPNLTQILKTAKKISPNKYQATYDDISYAIDLNKENISISYIDKLDNNAQIVLKNTTKNKYISNSVFIPSYPSDFDLITQ